MDWDTFGKWATDTAGGVIDKWATFEYETQPKYNAMTEAARWQALGETGYYTEGQPGTTAQPAGLAINGTTMLMIGAVFVAVLLLKD